MRYTIIGLLILATLPTVAQKQKSLQIGFYNTENLFDTMDDPKTMDEEFLPEGKLKWDITRFNKKLQNIARVMRAIDSTDYPEIMGFCEIENRYVLEQLISKTDLKKQKYDIVHYDSPDDRGIDVGLIYKKSAFKVLASKSYRIYMDDPKSKTRDILVVSGILAKKDTIHVLVNHWPSRRSGEAESEPKRVQAATVARHVCDSLSKKYTSSQILLMGDFNDEPTNKSIEQTLGAGNVNENGGLINLMYAKKMNKEGSHFYNKEWGMLDQIIVSKGFLKADNYYIKPERTFILKADFLLFENKKTGEKQPNRTYVGEKYVDGFSDHLPVYVELVK